MGSVLLTLSFLPEKSFIVFWQPSYQCISLLGYFKNPFLLSFSEIRIELDLIFVKLPFSFLEKSGFLKIQKVTSHYIPDCALVTEDSLTALYSNKRDNPYTDLHRPYKTYALLYTQIRGTIKVYCMSTTFHCWTFSRKIRSFHSRETTLFQCKWYERSI